MANTVTTLKRLRELPLAVQDFIFDENAHELGGKVIERSALNDEQTLAVFGLLKEIYLRDVPLEKIVAELEKRLGFDEEKARRLAADIAGYQLLPLDKWLGDVDGYLRRLGADPKLYPATRIQVASRTADEAAEETIKSIGDEMAAASALKKRQEDLLKSFFSGIRNERQLKEMLTRPTKVGGIGMEPDQAERFISAATAEKAAVQIRTFSPGAAEEAVAGEAAGQEGSAPSVPQTPKDTFATVLPEDELEIEKLKKKVAAAVPVASQETARQIEESIKELYALSGYAAPDEVLEKRLKMVIGNRLRDVRDSLETVEALAQSKQLGGMGFSESEARRVVGLIEAKLKQVHATHQADVQADKRKWVENEAARRQATEEGERRRDSEDRDRLFAELLAKTGKAAPVAVAPRPPLAVTPKAVVETVKQAAAVVSAPVVPPVPRPVPETKVVAPPPNLPKATPIPVPAPLRPPAIAALGDKPFVAAAPPLAAPATNAVARPGPSPMPAAPLSSTVAPAMSATPPRPPLTVTRPAPPAQAPVAAPAAPSAPPIRPKVEDVRPPVRLIGPIDEIRTMSLADFRKLARDPKDAATRVREKIDLLRQESFERRSQAIEAWGASEISRTYLETMREALSGKPMAEVMAGRQAAGKAVLTADETAAVAELNRQLRY